jgi:asparagine synthase (glutamine-hydrolysing)
MCGIWIYLIKQGSQSTLSYGEMYEAFMNTQSRGPDRSSFLKLSDYGLYIGFHRLSIMDTSTAGDQPFVMECPAENKVVYVVCNGEIYNYKELCEKYNIVCKSGSDCEVILHLYKLIGIDALIKELNGEFSFCIADIDKTSGEVKLFVGRDQCGIRPLFITQDENELVLTSTLEGSPFLQRDYFVEQFRPRNYATISNVDLAPQYTQWLNFNLIVPHITDLEEACKLIRETLIECVRCKMSSDRPIGALLSGGVDSSLVCAIASEYCKEHGTVLHTFSIGMDGSPDSYFAQIVADHIGSIHTNIELPEKDWLNAIEMVTQVIASYDTTSVRASTGQYLISKWIAEYTSIKVLTLGDGMDELGNGYKYNHNCPGPEDAHIDTLRLVNNIHFFDVLRADRGVASNGIEARVPYLDTRFINAYLSIDPKLRMPTNGMEKWLLRKAFDGTRLLPECVLYRNKTAFSDGCSSKKRQWRSIIQEQIDNKWSNEEFEKIRSTYDHCIPDLKESLHYRQIFERKFGTGKNTAKVVPYFWLPMWCGNVIDPSARILTNICKEDDVPE